MKEYEVVYAVQYRATVRVEDGESLPDAIADIDIPEGEQASYVQESFQVRHVSGADGPVPACEYEL